MNVRLFICVLLQRLSNISQSEDCYDDSDDGSEHYVLIENYKIIPQSSLLAHLIWISSKRINVTEKKTQKKNNDRSSV